MFQGGAGQSPRRLLEYTLRDAPAEDSFALNADLLTPHTNLAAQRATRNLR